MWQEFFKLPFENCYSKVFDNQFHMVFDFLSDFYDVENMLELDDKSKKHIVDCLNGNYELKNQYEFSYNPTEGLISLNNQPIIMLRGWGFLTGIGGCKLDADQAFEIQKSLGNWIINKLNNKK